MTSHSIGHMGLGDGEVKPNRSSCEFTGENITGYIHLSNNILQAGGHFLPRDKPCNLNFEHTYLHLCKAEGNNNRN